MKIISWKGIIAFFIAALFLFYEMGLQTSPSILVHYLMHDLNINAAQLGLMASAYFYAYTFMQVPAGLLLDRFSTRRMLSMAIALCLFGTVLFSSATTGLEVAAGRFLMGIGSAFAFIGVLIVAAQEFPQQYFAFFVGVAQLLAALGALGGELPLAMALQHMHWRMLMVALALGGLFLLIACYLILRDQPLDRKPRHTHTVKQSLQILLRNRQTAWVALYAFCSWGPITVFAALWGLPYLSLRFHLSTTQAASAMAFIWIGLGLVSPFFGWLSDWLRNRRFLLTSSALLGCFASATLIFVPNLPLWILCSLLFLFGIATAGQVLSFAVVRDIQPSEVVATAIGLNNMAVVAGGALLQPLAGYLLQWHWSGQRVGGVAFYQVNDYWWALSLVPCCFLVAALVSHFAIRESYRSARE